MIKAEATLNGVAVVPTLVMACISYTCIERPALSFKPRTGNANPVWLVDIVVIYHWQ